MNNEENQIILVKPRASDKQAVLEYRDEFLQAQETPHGSASIENATSFESWLQAGIAGEHKKNLPKDRVPATQYLAIRVSDHRLVGMLQIRHSLNEYLEARGGHIGYSVRKSERRKGYATQMLKQAIEICETIGIHDILLTCDSKNIPSSKVIKANGGTHTAQIALEDQSKLDHYRITLHP